MYCISTEQNNNNENKRITIHLHLQYDNNNENSIIKIVYNMIIVMNWWIVAIIQYIKEYYDNKDSILWYI